MHYKKGGIGQGGYTAAATLQLMFSLSSVIA